MCGLFGVVSYGDLSTDNINKLTLALGRASEIRGTDAGGLSYVDDNKLRYIKNSGAISKNGVLKKPISTWSIMGHTRLGTGAPEADNFNNHPFPSTLSAFTMAHNGIISNDADLAKKYKLPNTKVRTDSYIVVRLLDKLHNGTLSFESIKNVSELLQGSFNLTFQDPSSVWLVKHNNPLYILNMYELGAYVYASTKDILFEALDDFYGSSIVDYLMARSGDKFAEYVPINSGDILRIDRDGNITTGKFSPKAVSYSKKFTSFYPSYYYDDLYNDDNYDSCAYAKSYDDDYSYDYDADSIFNNTTMFYNRTLIHNGKEVEHTYDDYGSGKFYSKYLGKIVDDPLVIFRANKNTMLDPMRLDDFDFFYNKPYYNGFMAAVSKIDSFKKLMPIVKKNKTDKKLLSEMLNTFLYLHNLMISNDYEKIDKAKAFDSTFKTKGELTEEINKIRDTVKTPFDLYEYLQVRLAHYYDLLYYRNDEIGGI